jgi:hypothetical protein
VGTAACSISCLLTLLVRICQRNYRPGRFRVCLTIVSFCPRRDGGERRPPHHRLGATRLPSVSFCDGRDSASSSETPNRCIGFYQPRRRCRPIRAHLCASVVPGFLLCHCRRFPRHREPNPKRNHPSTASAAVTECPRHRADPGLLTWAGRQQSPLSGRPPQSRYSRPDALREGDRRQSRWAGSPIRKGRAQWRPRAPLQQARTSAYRTSRCRSSDGLGSRRGPGLFS